MYLNPLDMHEQESNCLCIKYNSHYFIILSYWEIFVKSCIAFFENI